MWCHHALPIEAALDRNDGLSPPWTGWSPQTDRARHEIAVADRVLEASSDALEPAEWAELAQQAGVVLDQTAAESNATGPAERAPAGHRHNRFPTPWIDPEAEQPRPGITL